MLMLRQGKPNVMFAQSKMVFKPSWRMPNYLSPFGETLLLLHNTYETVYPHQLSLPISHPTKLCTARNLTSHTFVYGGASVSPQSLLNSATKVVLVDMKQFLLDMKKTELGGVYGI